ncbi:uncharacterized protein LOC109528796 [Hippocampus comes]|uniref:uncharacterized protein LOC109528796 n=1 Tax=Hippocampus comes TaxID=109280 RepID=UPI00094EEE70|nr:PREDICTED: uncharacterized protein LOC109528796 [Hippocampus comes]
MARPCEPASVNCFPETKLIYHTSINVSENVFGMFNVIGCPLLLTCMCIERYLAVVQPVLYLKVRKWEYRVAVSSVVWLLTFSFCLASGKLCLSHGKLWRAILSVLFYAGIINDLSVMLAPVCIVISCLFHVMFASLMGVVLSLRQQSPAYTSANQAGSPLKRRAAVNVLTVVVPAVIAYTPVCVMLPLLFLTIYNRLELSRVACVAYQFCQMFPRLGVLIGPLFYLAKAKQIFCLTGKASSARGIVS